MSAYKVVFRIRGEYFDQIVAGTKIIEVRRASPRWTAIAANIASVKGHAMAVFVCGRKSHRREILGVMWMRTAEQALGRKPSPQGQQDLGSGPVFAFLLGAEMPKE